MKVLLILTSMPGLTARGCSSFSAKYIEALTEKGVEVSVVRIRSLHPARRLCKKIALYQDVDLYELSILLPRKVFGLGFPSFLFRKKLRNLGLSYDVVHACNGWLAIAARIASAQQSVNYLVQFIGTDANIDLPLLMKKDQYRMAIAEAKMLSFNSKELCNVFEKTVSLSKIPKAVIRRGVNLHETEFSFDWKDEIVFTFLGGIPKGNEKGFFTLSRAIASLNEVDLETRVRFLIGGPQTLQFEKSIAISNPNISVSFIGELPHPEVIETLRSSHVVLIPSLHEGIPNVLYEAMATGNMVIASNVGGIPEILDDGVSGWLIEPNNVKSLSSAIRRAVGQKDKLIEYAMRGRKIVENYGYDKFIAAYLGIYSSLSGR